MYGRMTRCVVASQLALFVIRTRAGYELKRMVHGPDRYTPVPDGYAPWTNVCLIKLFYAPALMRKQSFIHSHCSLIKIKFVNICLKDNYPRNFIITNEMKNLQTEEGIERRREKKMWFLYCVRDDVLSYSWLVWAWMIIRVGSGSKD